MRRAAATRSPGKGIRMNHRNLVILAVLALVMALAIPLQAAETVHLYLKINGADVQGESSQTSLGRENSIECIYYENTTASDKDAARRQAGLTAGAPSGNTIIIRKRIDKSSPLLIQAVAKNQTALGTFKFFRPNPTGDGTTQQFYTVEFEKGRVESVKQYVPDTISPATSTEPPMEEVIFSYTGISYSYLGATATGTADGWKRG